MKRIVYLLLPILLSTYAKAQQQMATIERANVAYDQLDLKKSYGILEAVLSIDTLQEEQKCRALRKLAHQDWKYHQNYALAKERLMKADSLGRSKYDTWMLISRIERESHHFKEALHAALYARELANSNNALNLANTEYAHAVFMFSVDHLNKGNSIDTILLANTSTLLSNVLETDAGLPRPSKLLLGIALLNNDGENVWKAWKSYFQFQDIQKVSPYLTDPAEQLNQVCSNWNGNKLSVTQQEVLLDALASSRFYLFIPAYVEKNNDGLCYYGKTKNVIAYSKYLEDVQKETNEYYRLIAIGGENEDAYITWLHNKREELWNTLTFTAKKEYSEANFLDETEKHFGARGFTGGTGNYSGYVLCLGHIVNQEKAKVEQYGFEPEFTYTQLDMMVSNGFSSWFWESKSIGGWATENEIIRVRAAYLNGPINAWKMVTDPVERQKKERIIEDFLNGTSSDQHRVAKGLAVKLKFDALTGLYDHLSSTGLLGNDLKLAFLSKYEQYRMEASILAHEGRHSIDQKYMPKEFEGWSNEEREFRAKLSQIIFAPAPKLELSGMVTSITGDSGHILANRRIVTVAIEWMKVNKENISGYSDQKSAFSQMHLLTKKQIKECYQQADPMHQ